MVNKYLRAIGWKTPRNRWDKQEIVIDLSFVAAVSVIVFVLMEVF